jgi:hypothetical protein
LLSSFYGNIHANQGPNGRISTVIASAATIATSKSKIAPIIHRCFIR